MVNHTNPYPEMLDDTHIKIQLQTMIAEEMTAAALYEQFAAVISDKFIAESVLDIAREEKLHAGEFMQLLNVMKSDDVSLYNDGMQEVMEHYNDGFKHAAEDQE